MRPQCVACGNYLMPCTATATGIHPKVADATTGRVVSCNVPTAPFPNERD